MPRETAQRASIEECSSRLSKSAAIAIVLAEHPDMIAVGSAFALASGLRGLGKTVSVFAPPEPAESNGLIAPWAETDEESEPLREFILSFDLTRSPIKELRYEKAENRLDIILSPTGSKINREDIEFRYGPLRYDIVVTLGVSALERAETSIRRAPELLHEKPILNIDANPLNAGYGELNLGPGSDGSMNAATIPELIFALLASLNALPEKESASALLAALSQATRQFHPLFATAGTFRIAGELSERGADPRVVRESLQGRSERDTETQQLLGRAMARSRTDHATKTLWLTLTRDDFTQTGADENAIGAIFDRVSAVAPWAETYALLWQIRDQDVRVAIGFQDPRTPRAARIQSGLLRLENYCAVPMPSPSFPDAEKFAVELLATPDGVE